MSSATDQLQELQAKFDKLEKESMVHRLHLQELVHGLKNTNFEQQTRIIELQEKLIERNSQLIEANEKLIKAR